MELLLGQDEVFVPGQLMLFLSRGGQKVAALMVRETLTWVEAQQGLIRAICHGARKPLKARTG